MDFVLGVALIDFDCHLTGPYDHVRGVGAFWTILIVVIAISVK